MRCNARCNRWYQHRWCNNKINTLNWETRGITISISHFIALQKGYPITNNYNKTEFANGIEHLLYECVCNDISMAELRDLGCRKRHFHCIFIKLRNLSQLPMYSIRSIVNTHRNVQYSIVFEGLFENFVCWYIILCNNSYISSYIWSTIT